MKGTRVMVSTIRECQNTFPEKRVLPEQLKHFHKEDLPRGNRETNPPVHTPGGGNPPLFHTFLNYFAQKKVRDLQLLRNTPYRDKLFLSL